MAGEPDLAARETHRRVEQTDDRAGSEGLARAGLADDTKHFAWCDIERDVVHRHQSAAPGVDRDAQPPVGKQQCLYDEQDAAQSLPKAEAAVAHLERINSEIRYEPIVDDINAGSIERIIAGATVVVDGLDGFHAATPAQAGLTLEFGLARLLSAYKLFELLDPSRIDVELTEEFQLDPEQSTSAIIIHHPEAKYFSID